MNQDIVGNRVILRPAGVEDRRAIYEWLTHSNIADAMNGPPVFPEKPIPTWGEFQKDYLEHYFNDSAPLLGRCFLIQVGESSVGQINYNDIEADDGVKRVELDIWMRSKEYCGKGYGVDALMTLCQFLSERLGVNEFVVQPSARNPQAIRAYEKAGFKKLDVSDAAARDLQSQCDYYDSVYMIRRLFDLQS